MWRKAGAPSGKVVRRFSMLPFGTVSLDVDYVYWKLAVVFRTWGGLCIRERGRIVSELRAL
mgnify:FL=1